MIQAGSRKPLEDILTLEIHPSVGVVGAQFVDARRQLPALLAFGFVGLPVRFLALTITVQDLAACHAFLQCAIVGFAAIGALVAVL